MKMNWKLNDLKKHSATVQSIGARIIIIVFIKRHYADCYVTTWQQMPGDQSAAAFLLGSFLATETPAFITVDHQVILDSVSDS